ncbi:unnamed protein product [Didymodactylos carnosus]|uniref:Zinc transporter 1 n=1 Tax=Didymodactylos carnosus TaxID=1234261 RepID=A0A814IJK9_9BILA|nr:unnamed protein product [Didymodactylos carnosus]CAF3797932.1 unnamed protein product [Didymodactylos carnosus]
MSHSSVPWYSTKTFRLCSMLALIFLYFIVEIVIGHITHSLALIADSFHMLADVLSLLIGLYSVRLSKKRSDINTYGWVRAEVVGANINTVFLLALSLTILFDVIQRYITPEPIRNVNMLLITGCVGLGINIIGMFLFQGFHGHSHGAGSHGDSHGGGKSHEHSHSTGDKRKEHGHSHGGHSRDSHGHGNDNPAHIPDVETPQKRTRHDSTGAEIFNHISNVTEFKRHSSRALEEAIGDIVEQKEPDTIIDIPASALSPAHKIDRKSEDKHQKSSKRTKRASMNMQAQFLHVFADALGSIVVIISALIVKFVPHDPNNTHHWTVYIDPTLSVIIIIIITISTIPFFIETSLVLLQSIPNNIEVVKLQRDLLKEIPEVDGIHELHVWRLTGEKIIASAHLHRRSLSNYMSVADRVKHFFHNKGIHSTTVQYECPDEDRSNSDQEQVTECLLRCENDDCDTQTCCTKNVINHNALTNPDTTSNGFTDIIQREKIPQITIEEAKPNEDGKRQHHYGHSHDQDHSETRVIIHDNEHDHSLHLY